MDYKELIEWLKEWHENLISELCQDDILTCDDLCGCDGPCIVLQAVDALTALAKENQGLRANKAIMEKILGGKHNPHDMALINQQMLENAQLRAELEQVKRERDAAITDLTDAQPCFACKNFRRNGGNCVGGELCLEEMLKCDISSQEYKGPEWEWRGPQKEE